MQAVQSERLCSMVKRVYEHVPFYKKLMDEHGVSPDDIKGVDDLSKLPFTKKTDLRDNYPYGLFAVPLEEVTRIHASSGTTGKQTVVGYTDADLDVWGECCGARPLRRPAERGRIFCMSPMDTACSREGLAFMPAAKK